MKYNCSESGAQALTRDLLPIVELYCNVAPNARDLHCYKLDFENLGIRPTAYKKVLVMAGYVSRS